jgi:hypothetical protein
MKAISTRIRKLEDRFCPAEPGILVVVSKVWTTLALDADRGHRDPP